MNHVEKIQAQSIQTASQLPIIAFFTGNIISYVGDMLTLLAIPWFVLQTTGSVVQTGITAFFSTLPAVLSAFFGSTLVDRLGYKRTSVLGDIASGLTVLLIPLLYSTRGLAFWQLLTLVFLGGLLKAPGITARSAMVPELAVAAKMRLERANALSDGLVRVSGLIGAPLAGGLILLIGTSNLLWFDALSFALSALLIGLVVPATSPTPKTQERELGYLKSLWSGVHFIQRDPLILSLIIVVLITNMIDAAFFSVIAPVYVKENFHSPLPLGILSAALGGSAFIGTLLFGALGHRLPRRLTFGIGYTIGGASRFWAVLLFPFLPFLIAVNVVAGLAIAPINPLMHTIMQERLPIEMRARVLGTMSAGFLAGVPIGTFASGYIVSWLGLSTTILIMGTLYLLATLSLLVNPALKGMES